MRFLKNREVRQAPSGNELGLGWTDFGARMYDASVGRWGILDPKADLLEMSSPYVYTFNNPLIYIDPDGELPILVNGRVSSDSERGNKSYWADEIISTIKNSGIANPGGQFHYVDGDRGFGQNHGATGPVGEPEFSASWATNASNRRAGGRVAADQDFGKILKKLEKDPDSGKIIEKIQVYTHSRGAAFGTGYVERLLELIEENRDLFANPDETVEFVFHMAPHQSNSITSNLGIPVFSIDHYWDMLSGDDIKGKDVLGMSTNMAGGKLGESHRSRAFADELEAFLRAYNGRDDQVEIAKTFKDIMWHRYGIRVRINN